MALGYLLEPFIQVNTIVGTPVVGAKIYVYKGNTSVLATTYSDFEGHLNTNPVRTNTLGNCTIIADDSISYDIEIRDALGLLLMSKKNITIGNAASGSGELTVDAGYGIEVTRTQGSWKVAVDTDLIATQDDLAEKQDKLQAGANIEITNDNTINVVNRREVVTEWPIKLERGNNRVKFYLDDDYANQFKTKQTSVEYGNEAGKYISYILQNENGEITASMQELPTIPSYTAGNGISIVDSEISCTGDITPYTAGTGIIVNNHEISVDSSVLTADRISTDIQTFRVLNEGHTLTQAEISSKQFTVSLTLTDYWNFIQNAKLTSHPQICLQISPTAAAGGVGNYLWWRIQAVYNDDSVNYLAWLYGGELYIVDPVFRGAFYLSKPSNLKRVDVVVGWYELAGGDAFNVDGRVDMSAWIEATKLVIS